MSFVKQDYLKVVFVVLNRVALRQAQDDRLIEFVVLIRGRPFFLPVRKIGFLDNCFYFQVFNCQYPRNLHFNIQLRLNKDKGVNIYCLITKDRLTC